MNEHNPYSPPTSLVSDAAAPLPNVRKPVSIWLLQIVCALLSLLLLNRLRLTFGALQHAVGIALVSTVIAVALQVLFASLLVLTIFATQRRSRIGQWLGVLVMGSGVGLVLLVALQLRYIGDVSQAVRVGQYLGIALVLAPIALLIYFPAFSKRARAWYKKRVTSRPSSRKRRVVHQ